MTIYDSTLATLPKNELTSSVKKIPTERYQISLWLALLLLLVDPLMSARKTLKASMRSNYF